MKLAFSGRAGFRVCTWNDFALLRDNVQHFIERGEVSGRYLSLHGIEAAVDQGECTVNALRLRSEVLHAFYALSRISVTGAAVSLRSRAILTGSPNAPARRGTALARDIGWELPVRARAHVPITEAANNFVVSVLALTNSAGQGELIQVRREGDPPRFARAVFTPKLPRIVKLGSLAFTVMTLLACSGSRPGPPSVAESEEAIADFEKKTEPYPAKPLTAPPPAYGNKIVHGRHVIDVKSSVLAASRKRAAGGAL